MTKKPFRKPLSLSALAILLAACHATDPVDDREGETSSCSPQLYCENEGQPGDGEDTVDQADELLAQQEIWQANAPERYFYTYTHEQELGAPSPRTDRYYRRISATPVEVESSVLVFDEYFLENGDFPARSVDELFGLIASAVQRDDQNWSVEYDPQYGYPSKVKIGDTTHFLTEFRVEQGPLDTYYKMLAKWLPADISRYSFELERLCDCDMDGRFEVKVFYRDSSATDLQTQQPLSTDALATIEANIQELFSLLKDGLVDAEKDVSVEYHEEYGFPSHLHISHSEHSEVTINVVDFKRYNYQELEKLALRRQQWTALNLGDYSYRYEYECYIFCSYLNYEIMVENGEVVSATSSNPPETPEFKTIDEMFDLAETYIARGWKENDIDYHPDYFFPVHLEYTGMEHTGDDDYWYTISEFTLIP